MKARDNIHAGGGEGKRHVRSQSQLKNKGREDIQSEGKDAGTTYLPEVEKEGDVLNTVATTNRER